MLFLYMVGLTPLPVKTEVSISIDSITFLYSTSFIEMEVFYQSSIKDNIIISVSSYDLEETENDTEIYEFTSNETIELEIPKNEHKTLYEVEISLSLYPESSKTYSFILYQDNSLQDSLKSINPIYIDFKNNIYTYEEFVLENVKTDYTLLNQIELPYFQDKTLKVSSLKVLLNIPINNRLEEEGFYPVNVEYKNGQINILDSFYYDFYNNKLVEDKRFFKVEGLNFPTKSFKVRIEFIGVGNSLSNIVLEKEYNNLTKMLGKCQEALFCFQ